MFFCACSLLFIGHKAGKSEIEVYMVICKSFAASVWPSPDAVQALFGYPIVVLDCLRRVEILIGNAVYVCGGAPAMRCGMGGKLMGWSSVSSVGSDMNVAIEFRPKQL